MVQVMEYALLGAFLFYLFATIAFVTAVTGKGSRVGKEAHTRLWGNWGISLTIIGVALHLVFIVTRVLLGGHFTSNMFEFTAFLCFTIVAAFIVLFFIYRSVTLGAFAMPVAMLMVAYAAVFPKDVEPLIPALQSYWLHVHVTTVAVGQGALAVGFVAGLIYLIRWVGMDRNSKTAVWLEVIMVTILMVAGFVITFFVFSVTDYQATIQHTAEGQSLVQEYDLPPIAGPHNGKVVQMDSFLGMNNPLFEVPSWMKGAEAAKKFNSVLWSVLSGLVLYALLRLLLRKRVYELLYPLVKSLDLEKVDEISYRAIAIGFPIFTLGGLVFAMIWAHEAWGRFWGWDPKETWALITWLYYSGYLHLRLSRGWHGLKSSWLAVGGFAVIMFNLIAINLVFAGLHSYA
ncbi:c-type cytochrome biogenesis protein CcsB [Kroppenstedtia eburnea]|uniref:Cytochrome c-type biogenesis protein CcsB n=1 Tax=Kroppenstedtia eburnea TaxID=714067 RepID=A0A1N7INW2_9BACL|nr:c-type cytochrome biogenesis protein CcsB [Kroppenstedtia eburnea]QKI82022.1 c-type cytochrome biogenesis protein CcsB [Kroppenstedtia eburnea]SIS38769.1 cytochrome c-type biogenesis protein CcsB [Kroppenstedtia eburnea]